METKEQKEDEFLEREIRSNHNHIQTSFNEYFRHNFMISEMVGFYKTEKWQKARENGEVRMWFENMIFRVAGTSIDIGGSISQERHPKAMSLINSIIGAGFRRNGLDIH